MSRLARLLITCPDRPGIVACVSKFLHEHGANIVQSDQYTTDIEGGTFFMRVEFDLPSPALGREELNAEFGEVAKPFSMKWDIRYAESKKRMAVFVSKAAHCLLDLLWQWRWGELDVDIPLVISNHETLRTEVTAMGIPFHHIPVEPGTKVAQEKRQLELMHGRVDFIVLARYMQILSPQMLARYPNRIINIHHSFLPAFIGAQPYRQAYDRGVKIIGATAHYATKALDEGPIIDQDVTRVDHRDNPRELARKGRNIERTVLSRAVKWHVEDRILVHGNKTVVFA